MAAGLSIINTHDTVQIDDTSPVLALRAKVNVSMVLQSPSNYCLGILQLPGYAYPAVAIRCDQMCWLQSIGLADTTPAMSFRTNVPATVTAYCFDLIQPSVPNKYLVINNAAGQRIFSAAAQPAIVVNSSTGQINESVPSGRTYAVCMYTMRLAVLYTEDLEPPRKVIQSSYAPACYTAGGVAFFDPSSRFAVNSTITSNPLPASHISRPDATGIILDVTGY